MAPPSVAFAVVARLSKQLPRHRITAKSLLGDVNLAISQAKRDDAKSCMSFWGQLVTLTKDVESAETSFERSFKDGELLQKHQSDLPAAREMLLQLQRLADLLDAIHKALRQLETEAKRISNKSSLLMKVKTETKDKKFEADFAKKYEAGISAFGLLASLILVYKKLAGKKVSLN
jgi:hypothetical protein